MTTRALLDTSLLILLGVSSKDAGKDLDAREGYTRETLQALVRQKFELWVPTVV